MANQLKRSRESATVLDRHGESGCYVIRADVAGWLKDALIDLAEARGVPFKAIVTAALEDYVAAEVKAAA